MALTNQTVAQLFNIIMSSEERLTRRQAAFAALKKKTEGKYASKATEKFNEIPEATKQALSDQSTKYAGGHQRDRRPSCVRRR